MNNNIKDTTSLVFVKGKNLLNKDSGFENAYISSTGIITPGNMNALFEQIIRVLPNTSYTISCKQIIHNFAFSIYDENNNFITLRFETGVSSMTQVMPQNAAYIRVQFNYDNVTTITQSIIDTLNVMLVQGPTSVPYEPYVDNQIHIKNKNGVFEEFFEESKLNQENYSLGEQKIGTWVNGKPLYRKVLNFGALPNNSSKNMSYDDTYNIVYINGYAWQNSFGTPIPNSHRNDNNAINLFVQNQSHQITIETYMDRSEYTNCFIWIYYTKTTD